MDSSLDMREASAGSPARPCAVRSEGSIGVRRFAPTRCDPFPVAPRWKRLARVRTILHALLGLEFAFEAIAAAVARLACSAQSQTRGFAKACDGNPGAGAPLRRRPRPPRRPRRRFFLPAASLAIAPATVRRVRVGEDARSPLRSRLRHSPRNLRRISPSANCACASAGSSECSLARLDCGLRGILRDENRFRGRLRSGYWQWSAQARQCFFCFFLPVRAAESFRGDREPLHGVLISFGFLFDDTELPGDHRVAGALIQLGKFCFCVGAVLRFANTRLNLPPISHGGHCSSRLCDRPRKGM